MKTLADVWPVEKQETRVYLCDKRKDSPQVWPFKGRAAGETARTVLAQYQACPVLSVAPAGSILYVYVDGKYVGKGFDSDIGLSVEQLAIG